LRTLLWDAVRIGALALEEAAAAEAVIVARCGGAGFATRAAMLADAEHMAVVRSTVPGKRGSILHAFLILDATSGHQGDWIVGDVLGALTFGEATRTWARQAGRIQIEAATDAAPADLSAEIVAAVVSYLPWLSGFARKRAQPHSYAVAELARIARIIQRCPESSIDARLKDLDGTRAFRRMEGDGSGQVRHVPDTVAVACEHIFGSEAFPPAPDVEIGAPRFGP
jgi:hypothetical protein